VHGLVARIRLLNPQPAACFHAASGGVIRPDAVARLVDGRIEVRVDDHELPMLGISPDYAAMVRDKTASTEVRAYLRGKIASAKNLIRAVEQRRRTLARVVLASMERQRRFLEQGRAGFAPLAMAEIAAELGLHVSTVSRAIAGKHVQTDRGVFPLRELFDGGSNAATHADQGVGGTGRRGVRERVAELIRAEDSERPLSDDDIVVLLDSRGIKVARRTVAKYRNELGIKTSFQRKSYRDGT
jgi:RNA polymerase sigma-54 factor